MKTTANKKPKRDSLAERRRDRAALTADGLCANDCGSPASGRLCDPCADKLAVYNAHGCTAAQYDALFAAQGGRCAICSTDDPKGRGSKRGRFCVDHDHATGAIRGLLCGPCNVGIGMLRDDPNVLDNAAAYLRHHQTLPEVF